MKLTVEAIKSLNNIHSIPKYVGINKNIVLDAYLFRALSPSPDLKRDYQYDFDVFLKTYGVNLQRPYVWEHVQQNEFILSLLLEKPVPPVVIVQHEHKINLVIDGKQRLLTIKKFLNNEFPIVVNGEKVFFKDFDEDSYWLLHRRVNYLTAIVYYSYDNLPVTDDMLITLFNFYNFAGTPQTQEHKNRLESLVSTSTK